MNFLNKTGPGFESTILTLAPVLLIVLALIYFKKKKDEENKENKRFGRRGRKDHTWQILKEYNNKTNKKGSTIEEWYLFDRPKPEDLHDSLVKGMIFREKQEKNKKNWWKKTKYPKRFQKLEDYFDALEKETKALRQETETTSHKVEKIRKHTTKIKHKRKRYVILYKTKYKESLSSWKAIEVELIKQNTRKGKSKDTVVVNKELDANIEMTWIEPLLNSQIEEKNKKREETIKKLEKEKKVTLTKQIKTWFQKKKNK